MAKMKYQWWVEVPKLGEETITKITDVWSLQEIHPCAKIFWIHHHLNFLITYLLICTCQVIPYFFSNSHGLKSSSSWVEFQPRSFETEAVHIYKPNFWMIEQTDFCGLGNVELHCKEYFIFLADKLYENGQKFIPKIVF